jgi:hypothetical protein
LKEKNARSYRRIVRRRVGEMMEGLAENRR